MDKILTSLTELKTGSPRCSLPPFPGETPPTMFVPYSMACLEWNVPCLPVKPWQMTRVFFVSFMLTLVVAYPELALVNRDVDDCAAGACKDASRAANHKQHMSSFVLTEHD